MTKRRGRLGPALLGVAMLGTLASGLAGCSADDAGNVTITVNKDDVYKVGCPLLDTVVGGGSVAGNASVTALKALQKSGTLGDEAQTWLDSAISVLGAASVDDIPEDTRKLVSDGCADKGYPLSNLS